MYIQRRYINYANGITQQKTRVSTRFTVNGTVTAAFEITKYAEARLQWNSLFVRTLPIENLPCFMLLVQWHYTYSMANSFGAKTILFSQYTVRLMVWYFRNSTVSGAGSTAILY
jgi:hypothetical protein